MSPSPPTADRQDDGHDLREALRAMARRDREAFRCFYDRTSDAVWVVARDILRDANAAEDCVLDVYLQAWEGADRFDPSRGHPLSWLLVITRSRALDRLRERRRDAARRAEDALHGLVGPEPEPAAIEQESERTRIVRAAVARLPRDQRRAVELAFLEGLPHTRIAAQLDLPLGTIKARIRRGLERLRRNLESREVDL